MTAALIGSNIGVPAIPNDPVRTKTYSYGVNAGGTSYILGAQLEGTNTALDNDVDGTVNGVDCFGVATSDTIYCVQL